MKPPSQDSEDYRIAVHEFGHFIACVHYGIPAAPKVFNTAEQYLAPDGQTIAGECQMTRDGTKFQNSVIGWSGMLAELIVGVATFDMPFPLKNITLRDWYHVAMCQTMSSGDRFMIFSYYKSKWLSFKAAYRILRRNKSKLVRLARLKSSNATKHPPSALHVPVPLPAQFPATRSDFLRLVVTARGQESEAMEQYGEFINDRVRRFWAAIGAGEYEAAAPKLKDHFRKCVDNEHRKIHSGKSDEEIAQVLFDETFQTAVTNEKERFEQGFQTGLGWTTAAQEFHKWLD